MAVKYAKIPATSYGMAMDVGLMTNGIHSKLIKVIAILILVFFLFIEKLVLRGLLKAKCHTIKGPRFTYNTVSNLDLSF